MNTLSTNVFLKSLPETLRPLLPPPLQGFQWRLQWSSLLQIHYGETALHYEIVHVGERLGRTHTGWELGFHCEARDHTLNRFLLDGFRRHLFEIKAELGDSVEAEMWDRGWTKIYEVYPDEPRTERVPRPTATPWPRAWRRSWPACTPCSSICAARRRPSTAECLAAPVEKQTAAGSGDSLTAGRGRWY